MVYFFKVNRTRIVTRPYTTLVHFILPPLTGLLSHDRGSKKRFPLGEIVAIDYSRPLKRDKRDPLGKDTIILFLKSGEHCRQFFVGDGKAKSGREQDT